MYRSPGRAQQHSGEAVKQKSYLFFHDPAESICTPFIIRSSRSDQNHRFLIYLLQVPRVLCTLHPAVLNIGFTWKNTLRTPLRERITLFWKRYRVTGRVFSKSVTSKLHLLFEKNLAGYLKTLKGTRISAMYTNFLHLPVHSGPSKFSRSKISNWSLGNTKANKNLLND